MSKTFASIGLIGHSRYAEGLLTHKFLYTWLTQQGYEVFIEEEIAEKLAEPDIQGSPLSSIGDLVDLIIVVGGDGNILRASRLFSHYGKKMIGVNRGTLGFLTDLSPDNLEESLSEVLAGNYIEDPRFLLEAKVFKDDKLIEKFTALNEVVVHSGLVARLIEFGVKLNGKDAFFQRSDGLIISTPTGSTAYSLSAGGAILEPSLNAIALVPMFPHSLSARPVIVNGGSVIDVTFCPSDVGFNISCDGQPAHAYDTSHTVKVKRSSHLLQLIHPMAYNYYNTLTKKLGWSVQLT